MASVRPWTQGYASVVACCPRTLRRLLIVAGLLVVGWLLGSAGQAHADTTPGVRLPHAAGKLADDITAVRKAGGAHTLNVPKLLTAPKLPAIGMPKLDPPKLGLPKAGVPSAGQTHGTTWSSRAPRPDRSLVRVRTTRHAATGAPEKAAAGRAVHAARHRHPAPVPSEHGTPRPLPHQAQTLPPSVGNGVNQAGHGIVTRLGTARRRPFRCPLTVGSVPPAVRTVSDEPTFAPD